MIKQILPNKLRVVMARRIGEEPDPPHVDFAGIGASNLDLLNIGKFWMCVLYFGCN